MKRLDGPGVEFEPAHREQRLAVEVARDAVDDDHRFDQRIVAFEANRQVRRRSRRSVNAHEPRALGAKKVSFFAKPRIDRGVGATYDEVHNASVPAWRCVVAVPCASWGESVDRFGSSW